MIEFINVELNVQLTPSLEMIATDDDTLLTIDVPPHSSYLVAGFAVRGCRNYERDRTAQRSGDCRYRRISK